MSPEPAKSGALSQTLGPGTLRLGAAGSGKEFGAKTLETEFVPELKLEDAVGLLSGDDYQPEGEWGGAIKGVFYQEYTAESLLAWCYEHAGEIMEFIFIPKEDKSGGKLGWKGKCVVMPVKAGGVAKKTNKTDFSFPLVGKATMGAPTTLLG